MSQGILEISQGIYQLIILYILNNQLIKYYFLYIINFVFFNVED